MRLLLVPSFVLVGLASAQGPELRPIAPPTSPASRPAIAVASRVDLVLCLDTSNSMDGLIQSAKQKLWAVVNDLTSAKPTPKLRVALLSYGNDDYDPKTGWVRLETDLTDDLDTVSAKLFGLVTHGGTEYVGRVVQSALDRLAWASEPGALKVILVAGNESADQDPESKSLDVASRAIARDVVVNAIYCGGAVDPDAPSWIAVAKRADGQFASIDASAGAVAIATPFDEELAKLGVDVNATYLPFGAQGAAGCANQTCQDGNAGTLGKWVQAERAATKAGANYFNGGWDLVDALQAKSVKLPDLKDADLPEALRGKTIEEKEKVVAEKRVKREELRKKIDGLAAKRAKHIDAELKRGALDETKSFDFALRRAVRAQAEAKGFRFEVGC